MYCQKCGAEIADEAVICTNCGCETGNATVIKEQIMSDSSIVSKMDKTIYAVLCALIVAFMFIPKYVERYLYIDGQSGYFDVSLLQVLHYSFGGLGYIVVVVLVLLFFLSAFFTLTSHKNRKINAFMMGTVFSSIGAVITLAVTVVAYISSEIGDRSVGLYSKFTGLGWAFIFELILMIILVTISVLNLKEKPISELLKK